MYSRVKTLAQVLNPAEAGIAALGSPWLGRRCQLYNEIHRGDGFQVYLI